MTAREDWHLRSLTEELLGVEKMKEDEVMRRILHVNEDAANSDLSRGHAPSKVEVSNSVLGRRAESITCPGVTDAGEFPVFTRDKCRDQRIQSRYWLACNGSLGAMVFAALALAFLVQERHPEEAVQTRGDPLVNGNSGPVFTVMGVNGKTSTRRNDFRGGDWR